MEPVDASGTEKAFEPATGNGMETGRRGRGCCGGGPAGVVGGDRWGDAAAGPGDHGGGRLGGKRWGPGAGWRLPVPLVDGRVLLP